MQHEHFIMKEVYAKTKISVACCIATLNDEWNNVAWKNEYLKEQTILKIYRKNVIHGYIPVDIHKTTENYHSRLPLGTSLKNFPGR